VSEFTTGQVDSPEPGNRQRRRRVDADRSRAAILAAADRLLGASAETSVEAIADAAGVTRQTVYAHFPSRVALVNAVVDQVTEETLAAIDALDLEHGSAVDALLGMIEISWQMFEQHPLVLHPMASAAGGDPDGRHTPVVERLERLIRRGQRNGEIDRKLPVDWLVSATIALGHAAGNAVHSNSLTAKQATSALDTTLRRLLTA
jgi:AcrR family transcriptional regulator